MWGADDTEPVQARMVVQVSRERMYREA